MTASDLHERLHELHFSTQGLDGLLERITVLAADMVDGDTGVGVTVIRDGRPVTVAASDERTTHFDEIQYAEGDGPCLQAARTGETVTVHDSASDSRWPGYLAHAAEGGLRSSLSVPLELGEDAAGALNTYVFARHEFDDAERATLGQFCDEASRAVSLALRYERVTRENDHLHAAMSTRRVIDQAIGIIMGRDRCTADEAFAILSRASQNRNVKINQLAADMIRKATGTKPDEHTHWRS
jgi:GAF domain-containing protein